MTVASPVLTKKPILAPQNTFSIDMARIAVIILGGGQGARLVPLTMTRCKPALSFGGRYRLIDIPISNAINSGCTKLYILTQFLSSSLHHHIFRTYRSGSFSPGGIELLPAEQKPGTTSWFQGTADAVRQHLDYFRETSADYFLILSGDQLYNTNFQKMVQFGLETNANLVVATLPVDRETAKRMGVLKINEDSFIREFCEKPQTEELLNHLQSPISSLERMSSLSVDPQCSYLGSMGIYLFKREILFDLLRADPRDDFGKHLIPTQVSKGKTAAYLYNGYWEDIGTVQSYYEANMGMTLPNPRFDCYDEKNPIFATANNLPPAKITNTKITDSIVCEGTMIHAKELKNTIIGPRIIVKGGTVIRNSYFMGNEFYERPHKADHLPTDFSIGENCIIERAIIDRHVHIGNNVQLINKNKLSNYNSNQVYIRDGIILVTRGANLPDGFCL